MLTLQECLDFSELTEEEIDAIAEHERVSEIVAAELGCYLLQSDTGVQLLKRFLLDDIERAERRGRHRKAQRLREVFGRFSVTHPTAGAARQWL